MCFCNKQGPLLTDTAVNVALQAMEQKLSVLILFQNMEIAPLSKAHHTKATQECTLISLTIEKVNMNPNDILLRG